MDRLQFEKGEMLTLFPQFSLRFDNRQLIWEGPVMGYPIRIVYPSVGYASTPPTVILAGPPLLTHHHLSDGALCLWERREWSPDYTAATVVGIVMRFLSDYKRGYIRS